MKFFPKKLSLPKISLPNSLSKMNYNFNPILHNRIVLYFISLLALFDMIYFLNKGDIISFVTFVLIGFLTSFFSKNMIVIFVIALSITHILKYGSSSYVSEGLETMEDNTDKNNTDTVQMDSKKTTKGNVISSTSDSNKGSSNKGSSSKKSSTIDESFEGKDKIEYSELKKEYKEFQGIQDQIVKNLADIEPALEKAEIFIKKFESYKEGLGKNNK